jgi:thiol-disulfide isomerase/thioredoxin
MASDNRSALGALGLVLALLVGLVVLPRVLSFRGSAMAGQDAPDFSLPLVANGGELGADGQPLHMSKLRGHAVLLDFWATWCGPCKVEAPIVDQIAKRWHDRGVVVVGVNTDLPDQGDPHEYAISHGLSYPIVQDVSGEASRLYEVQSIPTLVVLSPAGKVVAIRTGITDDGELERLLQKALD